MILGEEPKRVVIPPSRVEKANGMRIRDGDCCLFLASLIEIGIMTLMLLIKADAIAVIKDKGKIKLIGFLPNQISFLTTYLKDRYAASLC